jgi:hypothetical protein
MEEDRNGWHFNPFEIKQVSALNELMDTSCDELLFFVADDARLPTVERRLRNRFLLLKYICGGDVL